MNPSCPVSGTLTDENTSRVVAFFVFSLAFAAMASGAWWVFAVLAADFAGRGFFDGSRSPLTIAARYAGKVLRLRRVPADAAPKVFAARIGLAFCLGTFVLGVSGFGAGAVVAASVFAACAALQAFAGVCVGCKAYQIWSRLQEFFRGDAGEASSVGR